MSPSKLVYNVIRNLQNTNSRNDKMAILENLNHLDSLCFKEYAAMVYDSNINYWYRGINKPDNTDVNSSGQDIFDEHSLDLIKDISHRRLTGHAGQDALNELYANMNYESRVLLEYLLDRDIRAGVTQTTFVKIWPDKAAFREFKIMRCDEYNEKTAKNIKWPAMAQIKYDAARVIVIVTNNTVGYRTRNGKFYDIENAELDNEFLMLARKLSVDPENQQYVFDGELYQIDPITAKPLSRQVSNGVATKLIRGTASKKEQSQVGITLWDVVDHTEFKNGLSKRVQSDRFETLKSAFNQDGLVRVKLTEYRTVNNEDEALNYASEAMKRGEEGIIVKDLKGIYEHKRSKSSLKIKAVIDNEFVITGFEYGKGKYENMIGALCCESADGSVKFNVGSGLTDSDRTELLNESIVGKIVTVRHNGKIPNSNGTGFTLFLPRFVEIRHDKNEADTI